MKIELLTVLCQQLSEKEAIMKVFFEIGDSFRELYLVVEPIKQKVAHWCYKKLKIN